MNGGGVLAGFLSRLMMGIAVFFDAPPGVCILRKFAVRRGAGLERGDWINRLLFGFGGGKSYGRNKEIANGVVLLDVA